MTAIYQDPDIDDWPMMAIDVNGPMVRLFDETDRCTGSASRTTRSRASARTTVFRPARTGSSSTSARRTAWTSARRPVP
jgi:hypothetical protein